MYYKTYYNQKTEEGAFLTHNAADIQSFRYPHLANFKEFFCFDSQFGYWRFRSDNVNVLQEFAAQDITTWEFLMPSARLLHYCDMTGVPYSDTARDKAFNEVFSGFKNQKTVFPKYTCKTICLSELKIRNGFEYIETLYSGIANLPVHFLMLQNVSQFPFGSVLKGTDIVVSDGSAINFGQDMLHALYHLKEGIGGVENNNRYVEEVWAEVPALYAKQLVEGRLSRRKRLCPSPHVIRFLEYVFLRAYLGLAFVPENNNECAHPVFSIIEPSIKLMTYPLRNHSTYDKVRILANAVLEDNTAELIGCFDSEFGKGSFENIFSSWSLFDKYESALSCCSEEKLDEIMFNGETMLPSACSNEIIKNIWKIKETRNENITLLSSCK